MPPDRYALFGNPVAHSLSPAIHARFAKQTGESIEYVAMEAPIDGFAAAANAFFASGGRGANVTLPFKVDAFRLAGRASDRARLAGAANFIAARTGGMEADNTDGAGLVADLQTNLGASVRGARVLILGAGGATRGIVAPLLALGPERLVIANRTPARAEALARQFTGLGPLAACALVRIEPGGFDLVINATSASVRGEALALSPEMFATGALAYDLAYGPAARAFLERARLAGAARQSDGLGMLVEQAAESFALWRGRRPLTGPVLAELRARL